MATHTILDGAAGSAIVPSSMTPMRLHLPKGYIDADWLCEVLGFTTSSAEVLGPEAAERLRAFEDAVDMARMFGRIKRYTIRDAATRSFLGYCFRSSDVEAIINEGHAARSLRH